MLFASKRTDAVASGARSRVRVKRHLKNRMKSTNVSERKEIVLTR